MAMNPHLEGSGRAPTDERNLRLMALALDICRDPTGVAGLELAAVWNLVQATVAQRSAVCAAAVNAGMCEVAMAHLHKSSPAEWIDWRTPVGLQASGIFHSLTQPCLTLTNEPDINMTQVMVDSGAANAVISALQAHELPKHPTPTLTTDLALAGRPRSSKVNIQSTTSQCVCRRHR